MEFNVKELGQVFTPSTIVKDMINLRKNNGRILEPSCGDGSFSNQIENCEAIEIDSTKCPSYAKNMDFFELSTDEKYSTIIGNPPYVKFQDIYPSTKKILNMELFNERTNLYLFFIHKCIEHLEDNGELIFITPRDFIKATSGIKLNTYIYEQGTITDFIDLGDKIIFKNYSPNCVIFRFQKGNFSRITNGNLKFENINGQLLFLNNNEYSVPFKDLFYVKVGAVSGADEYFTSQNGNREFVCSKTRINGTTKRMYYNTPNEELIPYKEKLLKRKLKKFTNDTWYLWGRNQYESNDNRIYVNSKTRIKNPFFTNECKNYDGSILGIFPKFNYDLGELTKMLNEVNWEELGFICDGRFLFSQKSLENCYLPETFKKFINT